VIYICENNQYGEWTRGADVTAGRIADRSAAYAVPGVAIDGNDVHVVRDAVERAVARARTGGGPSLIEAVTYRHRGHEEGEEAFGVPTRPTDEVADWLERDPLSSLRQRLVDEGVAEETLETIDADERARIDDAVRFAEASPLPDTADALGDVYAGATA
jgi:pyruvate dehydrogenase E1 component alpha subunit